jgi:hypothetical protein
MTIFSPRRLVESFEYSTTQQQAIADWLEIDFGDLAFVSDQTSYRKDRSPPRLASIVVCHRSRSDIQSARLRQAIESVVVECLEGGITLLCSSETPLGSYIQHVARRRAVPICEISSPTWGHKTSPRLPWIDRALVAYPNRIYLLDGRTGSKTTHLIRMRLTDIRFPNATIFLDDCYGSSADREEFQDRRIIWREFLALGAVPRLRYRKPEPSSRNAPSASCDSNSHAVIERPSGAGIIFDSRFNVHQCMVPIFSRSTWHSHSATSSAWLTHCTRACHGPWPDQSQVTYFDSCDADEARNPSPLATLHRILVQQRLLATSHLKRDSIPSLSLSEVPLEELLSRRRYRSHVQRWDWEPYGLCIQRKWLEQLGGQPVIYGDERTWQSLPETQRPFFQSLGESQAKHGDQDDENNWSQEREWRLLDDLRLADMPFEAAFVFVPTRREARQLQHTSRFAILSLELKQRR